MHYNHFSEPTGYLCVSRRKNINYNMQQTETETIDVLGLLESVEPEQFTVRLLPSYYNAFMEEAERSLVSLRPRATASSERSLPN